MDLENPSPWTARGVFRAMEAIYKATDLMAEQRIAAIKNIKGRYLGNVSHRFPGRKSRQ